MITLYSLLFLVVQIVYKNIMGAGDSSVQGPFQHSAFRLPERHLTLVTPVRVSAFLRSLLQASSDTEYMPRKSTEQEMREDFCQNSGSSYT